MKIGLAAKYSKLEWDQYRLGLSEEKILDQYKQQNKDVEKILQSHSRQKRNIEVLLNKLGSAEIVDILAITKGKSAKPELDMLIAMGGDNFFQICSHYFADNYLVGVNTDPLTSKWVLLKFNSETLSLELENILNEKFKVEEWSRISTKLQNQQLENANCTVALSIKATDQISRYLLSMEKELGKIDSEEQKFTGILVVSGAGSEKGAWYRNAGLYLPMINSKLYPNATTAFSFSKSVIKTLVREPMDGEDCHYKWLNQTIPAGQTLKLKYWANDISELSIDSIKRYDVKEGDELEFSVSDKKLRVVVPSSK
ncbi:hypothetical protein J4437_06950 [Candidatus Woesearchaeota archaeon]|nr:hypothetical protein [Candidatus Woesearchaeota archaeon]